MQRENLVGQKFGFLTVTKMLYDYNGTNRTKCLCDCDCGTKDVLRIPYTMKKAVLSSCGCAKKQIIQEHCGKDITGEKYGRLLIQKIIWDAEEPMVVCQCDCGSIVTLRKHEVQSGHTKSCGCLKIEHWNEVNNVDHSGKISETGVKILSKAGKNKKNQQLWNCECVCGEIFQELPARILNGHVRSCGCIKKSNGELLIESFLKAHNVPYVAQYKFDDCKSDRNYVLHFDFAIIKENKAIHIIEYDGMQHFIPIDNFGGEESFKRSQIRDSIKNEYCKRNGIPLTRFNYTQSQDEIIQGLMSIIYP